MDYGFESFGGKRLLSTKTTDPMGNVVAILKGTMGQQIAQTDPYGHITVFEYDCIGQLTKSTDPDGHETQYRYDMLGRMFHRHHPDAGDDSYEYDPAGNLTRHTNAAGEYLDYVYHYNQLTDILYSQYPENNVHYGYGTAANADINAVGKIIFQEDASGWQIFKYGKLGEVVENIRTFALPFENQPYTFRMQYEYDSWNRIQKMTYPDGEEVHYEYNLGGMLKKISGNKNGVQHSYIDSIAYNEFELKRAVYYGNGTLTFYRYDVLQRLSHLRSECADGVMQDLYYDYDDVSNITSIDNYAGMLFNGLGGRYRNDYTYDNLYRLVHSDGEWAGDRYLHYDMDMSYLKNGRLQRKSLVTETWIDGNPTPINYDNHYHYDENQQPNTVRGIDGSHHHDMQWDVKGNLVRHRNHHAGYDRRLCWDEQNRLIGVADNSYLSLYQYDANGDRTYKLTGRIERQNVSGGWRYFYVMDKPTLYTSPYLVATRHGYTKHYYTENERVASRIGGGGLHGLTMTGRDDFQELLQPELPLHHPSCIPNNDEFKKKCDNATKYAIEVARCLDSEIRAYAPLESLAPFSDILNEKPDCYWYHTDHLGSSSWITYTDGTAVEHLHYLPWGEEFVRQRTINWAARYTFSAKEKDTETGYSYFGARYYSSDLSIWLSVDPQAAKYPHQSNYVYCSNNPIKIIDPNGEDEYEFDECGVLIKQTTNEQYDQFHIIDNDGNRINSSDQYHANTFFVSNYEDNSTLFKVIGNDAKDVSEQAFVFLANNTDVEWERVETNDGIYLGSNHEENSGRIGGKLLSQGYTINAHDHNHPSGNSIPSEADHNFATTVLNKNPKAKLQLHISPKMSGGYEIWLPYNANSTYKKKGSKELITPSKNK